MYNALLQVSGDSASHEETEERRAGASVLSPRPDGSSPFPSQQVAVVTVTAPNLAGGADKRACGNFGVFTQLCKALYRECSECSHLGMDVPPAQEALDTFRLPSPVRHIRSSRGP